MPISYDDYKKKYKNQIEENRKKRRKEQEVDFKQYQKQLEAKSATPKTTSKKKDERTWFEAGAFSDGWDFGDVTKTLLGTSQNLTENLYEGVLGIGEKTIDTGAYLLGAGAGVFGNNKLQDNMEAFIQKDLIDEEKLSKYAGWVSPTSGLNYLVNGNDTEKNSLLGDKSESVIQSAGQLGATLGLQMVGVPWWLTTGTTSFGGEVEQAFNQDATYGEAGFSGLVSAGAEVLTEKISGGISFGGKTLDKGMKELLTKNISNKTAKALAKFGFDMVGEGGEEVLTEVLTSLGKKISYEDKKTWEEMFLSEEAFDNYLEAFIGGAVLGGAFNTVKVVDSIRTGRDYDTGLSDREQSVVDSIVKEKIGKVDKKLSSGEIAKIEEETKEDLQNGNIDTNDIENILGKDITGTWKQLSNQIGELQNQLDEITDKAQRQEIQNQIKELQKTYNQDTYLQKSYYEKSLRSKNFTYEASNDMSKEKQALYESASQVMNDTTRSHKFVETVAKIIEKTGTKYRFTNTKQLQEMGHHLEGKNIDGLINNNGEILINVDSNKALNQILGHETTHLLEGTKDYDKLQKIAVEYAKTRGEYDSRLAMLTTLYKGTNANINNELTSDIVGDYLFTDKSFVEQLASKEPNIFQKIYKRIKELVELVTSSKEKRQLLELKRTFEEALKNVKKKSVETTNKQVVEQTKDNSPTEARSNIQKTEKTQKEDKVGEIISKTEQKTEVQEDIAPVKEEVKTEIVVSDKTDNLGRTLTEEQLEFFEDSKVRDENGNLLTMYHGTSAGGYTVFDIWASKFGLFGQGAYFTDNKSVAESYTEKGKGRNKQIYEVYLNITNPIDMDAQGDVEAWAKALSSYGTDISSYLETGTNEQIYRSAVEYLAEEGTFDKYEIAEIMAETFEKMGYDGITHIGGGRFNNQDGTRHRVYIALDSSQVKNVDNTKPTQEPDIRYSLSESTTDNQGRKLSKAQQEFFKDSKVRDDDGNLKVMYHGTTSDFNVFDINQAGKNYSGWSRNGKGFYFTDKLGLADFWANESNTNGKNTKIMEVYLNVTNPFNVYENYVGKLNDLQSKYKIDDYYMKAGYRLINILNNQGYDSSEVLKEYGFDGIEGDTEYTVFNSNQIKNVDNLNPTESEDIRYSLSENQESLLQNKIPFTFNQMQYSNSKTDKELGYKKGYTYNIKKGGKGDNVQVTVTKKGYVWNNALLSDEIKGKGEGTKIALDLNQQSLKETGKPLQSLPEYNLIGLKNHTEEGKGLWDSLVRKGWAIKNDDNSYSMLDNAPTLEQYAKTNNFNLSLSNPDTRYSLSEDSEGRELSKQQIEFFKDSKARDNKGRLLEVYHGTENGGFNIFNAYNDLNWVATSKEYAENYADDTYNKKSMYVMYANITNPVYVGEINDEVNDNALSTLSKNTNIPKSELKQIADLERAETLWDITNSLEFRNLAEKLGYDGIEATEGGYKTYATFNSNQIKNVDNLNPTDDADIRYSLSTTDNKGRELSKGQIEFFKDNKVRDNEGNLLTVYHGTRTDFNIFDKNRAGQNYENDWSSLGKGFYFTDDYNLAYEYSESSIEGKTRNVKEVYLNIKNPFYVDDISKTKNYEQLISKLKEKYNLGNVTTSNGYVLLDVLNYSRKVNSTEVLKEYGYDGIIGENEYVVFESNQIKNVDNLNPTENDDIRYSLSEKTQSSSSNNNIIIENNEDISKLNLKPSKYQSLRPKPRGGWTIDKIQKQLKHEWSGMINTKELKKFDNMNDVLNNTYYHGSISSHSQLKAGSTLKESERTGGYGEAYHSISLSGNRNIASNFASMGQNGVVIPVILKKGANVIEMPNISDSIELEDYLPELWNKNVDAVKIGDWDIEKVGYGEQEMVILNPESIMTVPTGTLYFRNYRKPRFDNLTKEELAEAFIKAGQRSDENSKWKAQEFIRKRNEGDKYYTEMSDEKFNALVSKFENANAEQTYRDFINGDNKNAEYSLSNPNEDILPKVQEGYTRLYRGLGNEYDANYDRTLLDNVNGYESWTDSYDLAKEYGENVYYIDIPTSEIKDSIIDEDRTSETYGDRNLIYANDKPVALRNVSGNEYMLYTDHDNYADIKYNKVPNINLSLSNPDTDIAPIGDYQVRGEDVRLQQQVQEAIAPLQETIQQLNDKITDLTESIAPVSQELVEQENIENLNSLTENDIPVRNNLTLEESRELDMYETLPFNLSEIEQERMAELQAEENLVSDNGVVEAIDPFENRDIKDVGNRKVKAYMYENPEVKPFFQQEAYAMLGDLSRSVKGEKIWIQEVNPTTGLLENTSVTGTTRQTTEDIAYLLDTWHYTYAQIEKGLHDIIEDNGLENNAVSKRIEFMLHDRLKDGYVGMDGTRIPANQDYINLLANKGITEYSKEAYDNWLKTLPEDYLPYAEYGRAINASNTEKVQKNVPLRAEKVQNAQETRIENVKNTGLSAVEELMDRQIARALPTNEVRKPKVTKKKTKLAFQELFINRTQAIDNYAVETKNMNIKYANDHANNVYGEISANIVKNQTDNYGNSIGKSITSIFDQARNDGLYEAFNDYLFHLSNIERHKNGKGSVVPLAESQSLKGKYEQAYPVMKKWAKEVNIYNRNNLNKQVESGLVSKGTRDLITSMYNFYVPFMENVDRQYVRNDTGEIIARSTVKRAKGGASDLLGFEEAMIRQTQATITAIRKNNLYKEIVKGSKSKIDVGADVRNDINDLSSSLYQDENGSYVTAYIDGTQQSAVVSNEIYDELYGELENQLKNVEQRMSAITRPLQKISEIRRNLLTTWSPSFMITNPIKDLQDAPLNSKYASDWAKNYPKALKELTTGKGKDGNLERFLSMYGSGNIMGEYRIDSGISDISDMTIKKNNKFLSKIETFNNIADLVPRYAEYLASIENGTSQMEALYNAREVTTNFGRGGVITKFLNRNGFTFLNASVQGMDKLVRNFSGENGVRGVTNALVKVAVLGIVPALFNHMMFGGDDDEEYEALPDYVKDNYYLIKTSDGEFIRIPKGRMISIFGSASRRMLELIDGEEDAFEGYLKNAYSQVGVANPMENNILAPLIQAYGTENGRTWYGEDLVPTRLQDVPKGEQYDSSTDKLSILLGEKLGISPYKLDYVLDQYSGGIGDLFLPMITEEASSDGGLLAPIADKFKVNSIDDNKYVGDFYSLSEELQKKSNSAYASEEDKLRNQYMYSVSSEMAKLYAERREIQSDSSLSKAEKYKKAQAIKEQINALAKEGLEGYKNINKSSNYATVGDKEFYSYIDEESGEKRWRKPNEDELEALNSMGLDTQEKSSYFNAKSTISNITDRYNTLLDNATTQDEKNEIYASKKADIVSEIRGSNLNDEGKYYLFDKYYGNTEDIEAIKLVGIKADSYLDYASQTFTADKNYKGDTISGSKKKKVFDYINSLDMDFEQKVILAKMEYNTYDEFNYEIIEYLNNSSITYEEEEFILKRLGFTVDDNGNIFWD